MLSNPTTKTPLQPIQIHIPPSLQHLAIPLPKFLSANPRYSSLVVGACIFAPQSNSTLLQPTSISGSAEPFSDSGPTPRILLVQRAATEYAFPNLWEVPGGSAEASDPTILHSVAREVFEETGLRLTRIVRQIGSGIEFTSRWKPQKIYLKLTFEIHVAEFTPQCSIFDGQQQQQQQQQQEQEIHEGNHHSKVSKPESSASNIVPLTTTADTFNFPTINPPPHPPPIPSPPITLEPAEHQQYTWVTEEEFKTQDSFPMISTDMRDIILQAFAERKRSEFLNI